MSAVKTGNRKDVEDLLEGGADVNAKDEVKIDMYVVDRTIGYSVRNNVPKICQIL